MKKNRKIRFPILLKVILLGVITSFIASSVAIVVNYNNLQNKAIKDLNEYAVESLETAKNSFDYVVSTDSSFNIDAFVGMRDYIIGELDNRPDTDPVKTKTVNDYPSFSEYEKIYENAFSFYYPYGMPSSLPYLKFRDNYIRINPILLNASIYSQQPTYFAFKDPNNPNRLIFLDDSRLETLRGKNVFYHCPGSFYDIKPTDQIIDIGHEYIKEYRLDKYSTRFMEIKSQVGSGDTLETIGYMFVEYDASSIVAEYRPIMLREVLILSISGLAVILLYAVLSYFMFVKNINKLNKVARGISSQLESDTQFELVDPNINSHDEMMTLSDSLIAMENKLINYVDIIKADAREKEKINAELEIASRIQLEALPKASFDDELVSVRSFIKPAKEVGGDFYDYFYINENELAIIVSDVSGKGIPASLFMMRSKALLKSQLLGKADIANAAKETNEILNENNAESLFVTSFIGVINFEKEEIRYVNAGHEKPYILSNGKVIKLDGTANFVLGGVDGIEYKEERHSFHKGDIIFMFTDGLNESIDDKREEFSYKRIEDTLSKSMNQSLDNILVNMKDELANFVGDQEAFDDVTMIAARFKDNNLKLSFDKKDPSIIEETVNEFEANFPSLDAEVRSKVGIILDELLNNLISYESRDDLKIDVNFVVKGDSVKMEIISNGSDYDPFKNKKEKYLHEFSHDIEEGGFGVTLVMSMSKSTKYKYKDGHSVITIEV